MLNDAADLSVEIRDLDSVLVAALALRVSAAAGTFSAEIGRGFAEVKAWAAQQGFEPGIHRVIGVPRVEQGQLVGYVCCVEMPAPVAGTDAFKVVELTGGRYAVLTMEKASSAIGPTIDRFFGEYVRRHALEIDASGPTYEIYSDRTMALCVPIR